MAQTHEIRSLPEARKYVKERKCFARVGGTENYISLSQADIFELIRRGYVAQAYEDGRLSFLDFCLPGEGWDRHNESLAWIM